MDNPFISPESAAYQKLRGLERHREVAERSAKELSSLMSEDGSSLVQEIEELLKNADRVSGQSEETDESNNRLKELEAEIRRVQEGMTPEQVREQERKSFAQLKDFLRDRRRLLKIKEGVRAKTDELIRAVHGNKKLRAQTGAWEKISAFEDAADDMDKKIFDRAKENPVAFQAHWLMRMREWKKGYETFGLIETDAIERQTRNVMHDARRKLEGTNGVVTLLGPTGSGKTVLAKKIGVQFSSDGQYEFVSAHPKMTAFDLIQRMGIVVEQLDPAEVPQKVKEAKIRYAEEHPDLSPEDLDRGLETIASVIEGRAKEKTFETKPILEAIGRAQRDGRIVVIDEFNYLPPETIAALNEILSNKDNPPGFGVVLTGNVGEAYIKRQVLDPAFINRVLSGTVQYEFPPQEIDSALDGAIKGADELEAGEKTYDRDLYQIAVTQLADTQSNVLAPKEALQQVWDFIRICSLTQKMAQGKDFRSLGLNVGVGVSAMRFASVFLSFRNINQVVREWKLGGFRQPLDWYIYDTLIRPAAVYAPKEAAEIMYLFRDWGGFFSDKTWDKIEVDPMQWRITGHEGIKAPKGAKVPLKAFQPAEVVEAVSGYRLPEEPVAEVEVEERKGMKAYETMLAETERAIIEWEREITASAYTSLERLCALRDTEGMDQTESA